MSKWYLEQAKSYQDVFFFGPMKQFYLAAIELECSPEAMYRLGFYYEFQAKDIDQALKYYKMGENFDHPDSIYRLAKNYHNDGPNKNMELAIKYYKKAVDLKHSTAANNLALIYKHQFNTELSAKYFKIGIELNNCSCMHNYADQMINSNYEIAIKYYLLALEYNFDHSIQPLVKILKDQCIITSVNLSNICSIDQKYLNDIKSILNSNKVRMNLLFFSSFFSIFSISFFISYIF